MSNNSNVTKKLVADSNGCIFNASAIEGSFLSTKGITLTGANNNLLHFIPETDDLRRSTIIKEVGILILAVNSGTTYEPKWPSKSPAAPISQAK